MNMFETIFHATLNTTTLRQQQLQQITSPVWASVCHTMNHLYSVNWVPDIFQRSNVSVVHM